MPDLLTPRDYYKPFSYPWAFDAYRIMVKMRWEVEEVSLADDIEDWKQKLTGTERNLLTQLFRFFTQGDVDVACAYRDRYMPAFKHPEIAMMLYEFAASEANHVFAYSLLLDTIGMPEAEYKAFHEFEQMRAKHAFLFASHTRGRLTGLAMDIAIFSAFSEGMQLFSSFAMLMNFQRRGLMKGMSTIVEWSIRDESHHVECMTKLFRSLIEEHPRIWTDDFKGTIYQACRDMVVLEDNFIDLAFALGPVDGMTADEVKTYIRFIADRRLNQLGLKSNYEVAENPLPWLDWIVSAPTHTNFFEQRSTEYASGGVTGWEEAFE
jgi:ribonucleoside-diphosphate reductase beta chain